MRKNALLGFTLLLLSTPMLAQKDKPFPKIFAIARFAYVETQYGPIDSTVLDPRVTNEDREAVADLEKAIQTWNRYQLTAKPDEAELIFVVRPGRRVAANGGIRVSHGNAQPRQQAPQGTTVGVDYGAEVGPDRDLLDVYVRNPDGKLGSPLWEQGLDHGLDLPNIPLFKKFKDQVEAATVK